jgi:uncharacterized protein (TIGR02246 family)
MRKLLLPGVLGLALYFTGWAPSQPPKNAEEEVLRKRAEAFVETFNKGDTKALAAFFTPDADLVDPEGHHVQGRKAIEEAYRQYFAKAKGAKLFIRITSVRVAKPDLALEDGFTEVVSAQGGPELERYRRMLRELGKADRNRLTWEDLIRITSC